MFDCDWKDIALRTFIVEHPTPGGSVGLARRWYHRLNVPHDYTWAARQLHWYQHLTPRQALLAAHIQCVAALGMV